MLTCHYPGDCTEFVIGQVMGPDTAGGYVEATDAEYDGVRTSVRFRPLTSGEALRTVIDNFGARRLSPLLAAA